MYTGKYFEHKILYFMLKYHHLYFFQKVYTNNIYDKVTKTKRYQFDRSSGQPVYILPEDNLFSCLVLT